jgi:hypothetical protein
MKYEVIIIRILTLTVSIAALYALRTICFARGTEYAGLELFRFWFILPILMLFSIEFFRSEYSSRHRTRAALTVATVNLVLLTLDILLLIF